MPVQRWIKDHYRELRIFNQRRIVMKLLLAILCLILFYRLYLLQVQEYQHFATLSSNNRVSIQALPPTRGLIYDRNGKVLAENLSSYRVQIIPEQVEDMNALLEQLSSLIELRKEDLARFKNQLKRSKKFNPIPLRFNLSDQEVAILASHRHRLQGVEVSAHLMRHYPYGSAAAHITGYVGRINDREQRKIHEKNLDTQYQGTHFIGKLGIEKAYEQQLLGSVGFQQVETNVRGRVLRVIEETHAQRGKDIYLNIDIELQQVAIDAFGDNLGALVAIDPNNGEVLSLVSQPGYDNNLFVGGISISDYKKLTKHHSRPLFNRALLGNYPPGSTTKPFIAFAGLEYGIIQKKQRKFCPGYYQLKDNPHKYRDWKKKGHGFMDVNRAIVQSCDVYFYDLAFQLGIDRIHQFLLNFGFGMPSGIDIPGESSGLLPSREWKRKQKKQIWFPGETLITGIGQGYMLATPLQLAVATMTLANGGKQFRPQLMRSISANEPRTKTNKATIVHDFSTSKSHNREIIIKAMEDVIHSSRGTARRLNEPGMHYRIAGKTGTAQVFTVAQDAEYNEQETAKKLRDHALFIAFAPVEKPQIAIAVIVENGGHGGSISAPIAGKVIAHYLQSKKSTEKQL